MGKGHAACGVKVVLAAGAGFFAAFLAGAAFFAGAFLAAAFLAGAAFFTAAFLAGAAFFTAAFLAGAAFLAAGFFAAAFLVAVAIQMLLIGFFDKTLSKQQRPKSDSATRHPDGVRSLNSEKSPWGFRRNPAGAFIKRRCGLVNPKTMHHPFDIRSRASRRSCVLSSSQSFRSSMETGFPHWGKAHPSQFGWLGDWRCSAGNL